MSLVLTPSVGRTFLPKQYLAGHEYAFILHDRLADLLRSGEKAKAFTHDVVGLTPSEEASLETTSDLFEWLDQNDRVVDKANVLRALVFPALLSDFLHFLFEGLESSRKAKLNVACALLRKPFQENLYLFEMLLTDVTAFSRHLSEDPMKLRAQKQGGVDAHQRRIERALGLVTGGSRFNAEFLAQIRYSKDCEDSFELLFQHALHLFTEHKALRTEQLNINFIFSDDDSRQSQWQYIYSRLPYLLDYAFALILAVFSSFREPEQVTQDYTELPVLSAGLLWHRSVPEALRTEHLDLHSSKLRELLVTVCTGEGLEIPNDADLHDLRDFGRYAPSTRVGRAIRGVERYLAEKRLYWRTPRK